MEQEDNLRGRSAEAASCLAGPTLASRESSKLAKEARLIADMLPPSTGGRFVSPHERDGSDEAERKTQSMERNGARVDHNESHADASDTQDEFVKISANLPAAVVQTLRHVAKIKGTSMTEVLRHAISLEAFLLDKEREGSKIFVEEKDKNTIQVRVTS